jgi:hypothetical protein
MSSRYLLQKSSIIRPSLIYCSNCYQSTDASLASILFPEPKPIDKNETPSPSLKTTTKQQAQAVVSSAADAAVNVIGAGWGALNAVSNRITGLTSLSRKIPITTEQLQSTVRVVTPETLQQRTQSLIRSVKIASSTLSQARRIEELSTYLLQNPDANYFTKKVFKINLTNKLSIYFVFHLGTTCTLFIILTSTRIS